MELYIPKQHSSSNDFLYQKKCKKVCSRLSFSPTTGISLVGNFTSGHEEQTTVIFVRMGDDVQAICVREEVSYKFEEIMKYSSSAEGHMEYGV